MRPVVTQAAGKTYASGVVALRGVSFAIGAGEMVAICGPSGCGKSTLLALLGCVDVPSTGTISIDGAITSRLNDRALTRLRSQRIGTVFQSFNLLQTLTIAENIAVPLVLAGWKLAAVERRTIDVLERVGIREQADRLPSQISGGQAQRAAIARAIVHEPAILLADEPTGNLDSKTGAEILSLLRELARGGQTIAMATHDMRAADSCDRTLVLRDGALIA